MLGHFFPGRTDFELIKAVVDADAFECVVIGAPGSSGAMSEIVEYVRSRIGEKLIVKDWLNDEELAAMAGSRTVALVPNLVNDYTLSQDLMKVYQFCALGVPIVIPRLLWPRHITMDFAFLVDYGVDLSVNLRQWVDSTAARPISRGTFISEHAWSRRAGMIAELLESAHARN